MTNDIDTAKATLLDSKKELAEAQTRLRAAHAKAQAAAARLARTEADAEPWAEALAKAAECDQRALDWSTAPIMREGNRQLAIRHRQTAERLGWRVTERDTARRAKQAEAEEWRAKARAAGRPTDVTAFLDAARRADDEALAM